MSKGKTPYHAHAKIYWARHDLFVTCSQSVHNFLFLKKVILVHRMQKNSTKDVKKEIY